MGQAYYRVGEFARKGSVSMRTLRYYDRAGILAPSGRSEGGYRLYTDADLVKLQYILALKYLGFSLDEIRACVRAGPAALQEGLAQQRAMLLEKRNQLNAIIAAIDRTQSLLASGAAGPDLVAKIMEVMQMEQKPDWMAKYLTPEQQQQMRDVVGRSYAPEALQKLTARGWTEEDHRQHLQRYGAWRAELARLSAADADPAGPEAQAMAERLLEMNRRFAGGDPEIAAGMRKTWENYNALPPDTRPPQYAISEAELAFIRRAMAARRPTGS